MCGPSRGKPRSSGNRARPPAGATDHLKPRGDRLPQLADVRNDADEPPCRPQGLASAVRLDAPEAGGTPVRRPGAYPLRAPGAVTG